MKQLQLHRLALAACASFVAWAGPSEAACRYVKLGKLPVNTEYASPRLDGSVNGKPIKMLFDTGASITALTRSIAESAELPLSHSNNEAYGAGGTSQQYNARVKEFTLGPAKWNNLRMRVLWNLGGEQPWDAVIGANFLFQYDVELSLKDSSITLFKPENCKDTYLGYWDADANVIPMLDSPITDLRPQIMIEVNGQPMRALLDTGATSSVIDKVAAQKLGIKPPSNLSHEGQVVGVGDRRVDVWVGTFDTVTVGSELIKRANLRVLDMWNGARTDLGFASSENLRDAPQVVLGADFLAAHRVLFAMEQRNVYLTHVGGPTFRAIEAAEETAAPSPAPASGEGTESKARVGGQ